MPAPPSPVPPAFAQAMAAELEGGRIGGKADLHAAKQRVARALGLGAPPSDRALAEALAPAVRRRHAAVLRTKPTRSRSGVAVVAVMSSPAGCPHGKCIFCPGGPEVDAPQSYTGFEPSTMRARRHGYDPYAIVRDRLAQLDGNGHAVGKVDLVIQGGTFPAREAAYQDWLVAGIYAALNDGPGRVPAGGWEAEQAWAQMPPEARAQRLQALMRANESAACRAIGLTIETKPDWCFEEHLDRMLEQGATRVEIGLQALDDEVLRRTHRGHDLADGRRAMRLARDAGLKVCVHVMPGLPRGPPGDPWATDPAADADDMRRLFGEAAWRPDMLKIYPTLVVQEGETPLKRLWQEGRYVPYDTAQAARVVGLGKGAVPPWCRIQRIDRDIPTTHVEAGVLHSNLRQLAQAWRAAEGLPPCRCLRCREAGHRAAQGRAVDPARAAPARANYAAGGGDEAFLAFEDPVADAVLGFVRVRRVGAGAHRQELRHPGGVAVVRELKVFGLATAVGAKAEAEGDADDEARLQHRGLGGRLMDAAERLAFQEWGVARLAVLAGPGVKAYYRRRGYRDLGPYVAKENARLAADLPSP